MKQVFETDVVPTKSSEPQVFVFRDNKLLFVPISTSESVLARWTTFTDLELNKLDKIVAQESMIIKQLQQLKNFAKSDPNIR